MFPNSNALPGAPTHDISGSADPEISYTGGNELSPSEMLTLYGLVRYPELNDRELSSILGFKASTLTAIKNRLKKGEMYRQIRIPIMEKLGSELLSVSMMRIDTTTGSDDHVNMLCQLIKKTPEIVFAVRESRSFLTIGYFRNYAQLRDRSIEMRYELAGNGILVEDSNSVIFPLSISRIMNNFDHSRILAAGLPEVPGEKPPTLELHGLEMDMAHPPRSSVPLSSIERTVMAGIIRYPDVPDRRIAEIVGTTRQAISRIKKKFIKTDLVRTIRIPNIRELGLEIMGITHVSFAPDAPMEKREDSIAMIAETLPLFFWVIESDEAILLSLHRNFEEFQKIKNRSLGHYTRNKYLRHDPSISLLSIGKIEFLKDYEYSPLIEEPLHN